MHAIRFQWDHRKAIEAILYICKSLQRVSKVKLVKLLYIADRDHFLAHGRPITGDDQWALPKGPVPTKTLDLLDGDLAESDECFRYVHRDDVTFSVRAEPEWAPTLTDSEKAVLDQVLAEHGAKYRWTLVAETHSYREYREVYREGTSTRIPYETILQVFETGNGKRFREGRPVVSKETAAAMQCPLPPWEE